MPRVCLEAPDDFDGFRQAARRLIAAGIPPEAVSWHVGPGGDLLGGDTLPDLPAAELRVPRAFPDLARRVICHRDPERFALLHGALVTLQTRPQLLDDAADPLVRRLAGLDKAVRRDVHKMRAFVRFREVATDDGEIFVAWFEPDHHIVRLNAGFFVRRFAAMRFAILTPDLSLDWDGQELRFSPGVPRSAAPDADPFEAAWATYYASIFNPARLKVDAMTREMPRKYWKNLPEAGLIPGLIADAPRRTQAMVDDGEAPADSVPGLAAQASSCRRCPLHAPATQTVFGEGPADAPLMLVGEQPGDQEDLAGRPFVGPAGQMLDRALAEAGIDRAAAYVTNAVKHFKFEPRGKRRIHARPDTGEITACRWWLDAERAVVKPRLIVALGATAARGLTGKAVTIGRERGRAIAQPDGSELWITIHPSFLLRIEDADAAAAEYRRFVEELALVRARLAELQRAP